MSCLKINLISANDYPDHVATYLWEEIDNNATLRPFKRPQIDYLHISPSMTLNESSSANRCVTIDLSLSIWRSVKSGVEHSLLFDFVLVYLSIDNVTDEVLKLGKGVSKFQSRHQ